jgi:hypothetical protein
MDFDSTTEEYGQWTVAMPSGWDGGTVTAQFYWTAAAGSGNIVWGLQGRAYANSDPIDAAWGTFQSATDTLLTANDVHISAATAAITLAGSPAGGQLVQFRVLRDADTGIDTLDGQDGRLIGVMVTFTRS